MDSCQAEAYTQELKSTDKSGLRYIGRVFLIMNVGPTCSRDYPRNIWSFALDFLNPYKIGQLYLEDKEK
jgi:hypothetical protein